MLRVGAAGVGPCLAGRILIYYPAIDIAVSTRSAVAVAHVGACHAHGAKIEIAAAVIWFVRSFIRNDTGSQRPRSYRQVPMVILQMTGYTLIDPSHLPSYGQASLDL